MRSQGFDFEEQVQETFWNTIGDAGTAQPLVLLAAVLERARPGDLLLVAGYGDGGDAAIFRATDNISSYQAVRSVYSQIEVKRTIESYGKYARFRKLIRKDYSTEDQSTPVVLVRDQTDFTVVRGEMSRLPGCTVSGSSDLYRVWT